jgi:DNA-binding response OmpR family regulator
MRILLAEDDIKFGCLIKHMLEKAAVQVEWVVAGDTAIDYAGSFDYDVIILDWMMPGATGLEVCRHLRDHNYEGAILMLTAKDAVSDRVLGLEMGADDYLVKPFEFAELLARVRALSRRSKVKLNQEIFKVGTLVLNCTSRSVQSGEAAIQLTGREFQVLELLMRNSGQVVPREVILDRIWGLEADVSSNNLDAYIRLLRKKICLSEHDVELQNVRGIGYKLEAGHVS